MAKEELFTVPILGNICPHINAFPVKRGLSDRGALKKGVRHIKRRKCIRSFSRRNRSKTGELGKV